MAIQTRLEDMVIGDKISFTYHAPTTGLFGVFERLGNAEAYTLGSPGSQASGLYKYYFIYVGNDFKGRMVLIADRSVQNSISWDTLNNAGIATKNGVPVTTLGLDTTQWKTNIRLLTGGASAATVTTSEWNKYIANGPIGSSNAIWNWNNSVYTMTSTTPSGLSSSDRVLRAGGSNLNTWSGGVSSSSASNRGFRPVLVAELLVPPSTEKYLVNDGGKVKTFKNGIWEDVNELPDNAQVFEQYGMTSLTLLTDQVIKQLSSSNPQLLVYTDKPTAKLKINYTPKPQMVVSKEDLDISLVEFVDSSTITLNKGANSIFNILASIDQGLTWKSFNSISAKWEEVNLSDIATKGMGSYTFNNITRDDWSKLLFVSLTIWKITQKRTLLK